MAEFLWQPVLRGIDKDEGDDQAVVPANAKALYTKSADGKSFELDKALAEKLDVSGLTTALDRERKGGRESAKQLAAWAKLGKTPEEVQARVEELQKAAEGKGGDAEAARKALERLKADMAEGHKKEMDAKDQELGRMRGSLNRYLVDSQATAAIVAAGGSPALLLPLVRERVKVVEEAVDGVPGYVTKVIGPDGEPRGNGKGGWMDIPALVDEMKKHKDFGRAFEAPKNAGSGKQPGGGGGTPSAEKSSLEKIQAGLAEL